MQVTLYTVLAALLFVCALGDSCVDQNALSFKSTNGRVELNGVPITIKGASWWGMETTSLAQGGLNVVSMESLLDFMVSNDFNAIRMPFALDTVLNPTERYPNNINYNVNPTLQGKTSVEVLDAIFAAAASRGILILLDQHRMDPSQTASLPLWYTTTCITNQDGVCKSYTIDDDKAGWNFLVNRYQSYWNFVGVDLINEPHGAARWGTGDKTNDWAVAAADIGNHIISSFPSWKGFIFVEGVELNPNCEIDGFPGCENCTNDGHWWGGNMEGVRCAGVALSDPTRLIYSPHVYGTSVYNQAYFSATSFPSNLAQIYQTHFNFLRSLTGRAIIIGEWGGYYTGTDKIIQDQLADFFAAQQIDCWFYWALNPNPGGDTDGLLNADWTTPNTPKLTFLASVSPSPTSFSTSGSQVCFSGSADSTPTSTPTIAPTQAPTQTPTQKPTSPPDTPTQSPTNTPTTPTDTPTTPTDTPTTPTDTPTTPTDTPTTPTDTPTTPTDTPTDTPTTPTNTPTNTPTTPTNTPTTPTNTPTTPTNTPTTPTNTPTTPTDTPTTPTDTPNPDTPTDTPTGTPTNSPTTNPGDPEIDNINNSSPTMTASLFVCVSFCIISLLF